LLILLFYIFGFGYQCAAQCNLLVSPSRVVFEGNKQRETLNLLNDGDNTATFSISFIQYDMKEDGSFTTAEKSDSGNRFADPYLQIFPCTVTLTPGKPQTVLLQFRRNRNMKTGEYRSHLYFRDEKNNELVGKRNSARDTTSLNVQLTAIFGISIPVIIRSGELNMSSKLSDIKLETLQDTLQSLKFNINRTGNISVYGDITIDYIPANGQSVEVGFVKGVAVYTNINRRTLAVNLKKLQGKKLKDGKLKIQYRSSNEKKRVVYAEGELEI
jgi:hypothetical protein